MTTKEVGFSLPLPPSRCVLASGQFPSTFVEEVSIPSSKPEDPLYVCVNDFCSTQPDALSLMRGMELKWDRWAPLSSALETNSIPIFRGHPRIVPLSTLSHAPVGAPLSSPLLCQAAFSNSPTRCPQMLAVSSPVVFSSFCFSFLEFFGCVCVRARVILLPSTLTFRDDDVCDATSHWSNCSCHDDSPDAFYFFLNASR